MWDSINATLLPSGFGANSPYINFGMNPMMGMGMGMNGVMPQVPYGGYGMFPGMGGGLPYDTFTNSNVPPLKARGNSLMSEIPTALKVIGGGILAFAAFKFFKKSPASKLTAK